MPKEEENKEVRFTLRYSAYLNDLVMKKAKELEMSKNEICIIALQEYLTRDITDESLLLAKLSDMQRTVRMTDNKIEVWGKMFMYYLRYFFLFSPEYPEDREIFSKALKNAEKRTQGFLRRQKEFMKESPRFLEMLLADSGEEV